MTHLASSPCDVSDLREARLRAMLAAIARGRPLQVHQWAFCAPRAINSSTRERNSFRIGDVFALL